MEQDDMMMKAHSTVSKTPLQQHLCTSDAAFDAQQQQQDKELRRAKWRDFVLIYVAYMCCMLCRKNYGFWLPHVLEELGADKSSGGTLGSAFEMSYGTFALLNGVVIDSVSPKYLLMSALLLSSLCNLGIAHSASLPLMVCCWGLNGMVQSLGWPSLTTIFLAWFPDPASRGAWYSLLSTCQNAGAALVPLLISCSIAKWGWEAALYTPGVVSTLVAFGIWLFLYGSPAAIEEEGGMARKSGKRLGTAPVSFASLLGRQVVLNPALWLMAINYFSISLVRSSLSDWSSVFLREAKGLPMPVAARCLFLLESGGFAGSLVAGAASDRLFGGRRGPVICTCSAMLAPALLALATMQNPLFIQAVYAYLGLCAFPVHVLVGLFSREVVPTSVSSSAGGFVKFIAQMGGAFAGYPLGLLQQHAGWEGVFTATAIVAVVSAAAALPLWFTTPAQKIMGRNGTVNDFKDMRSLGNGAKHKLS